MNKLLKNEQEFAKLNQQINNATAQITVHDFPADFVMGLYCECANKACLERLSIPFGKYRSIKDELTFVVKPEHYLPEFENLESKTPDYWVIRKRPEKLQKPFDV